MVCFIKCELPYTRLIELENDQFKVLWVRVRPFKMPRKFSCIIFVCLYHPPDADSNAMRDYLIHSIDSVLRKYPESGIVISGDFNQLRDSFLRTHYRFKQVVQAPTRGLAILDKLWTNMYDMYEVPYVLPQLGTSDHNVILWKPIPGRCIELGKCKTVSVRCIGNVEKAKFAAALANVGWEPLFRLQSCEHQFALFQSIMNKLIVESFPYKNVKRHCRQTVGYRWI